MKKFFVLTVAWLLLFCSMGQAAPVIVKSAWLNEFEALPAWYAHLQKWDAKAGIDLDMQIYPSGKYLVDNMASVKWDVAGFGGAPAVLGILRKQVYVIGIGSNEAAANVVYVRSDSPLITAFQQKLSVRDYAQLLTGRIILCPCGTSAHQLLLLWLDRIGLSESSVSVMDVPPGEAVKTLSGGVGDMAVLWSPEIYLAEEAGLKPLLSGADLKLVQPTLLMANRDYADSSPSQVKAFLACYLKAVDALQALSVDEFAIIYQQFQKDFCQYDMDIEQARREVETHKLCPMACQRALLSSQGELRQWLYDVITFHERTGELSRGQARELNELPFVTNQFIPTP